MRTPRHPTRLQDAGGGAWRGRGPLLGDVLRLHLSHRSDRVEAVRALAAGELAQVGGWVACEAPDGHARFWQPLHTASASPPPSPCPPPARQVPDCTKGADAAASVDPYPSLCGHTVATWYRACFEQLQARALRGRAGE